MTQKRQAIHNIELEKVTNRRKYNRGDLIEIHEISSEPLRWSYKRAVSNTWKYLYEDWIETAWPSVDIAHIKYAIKASLDECLRPRFNWSWINQMLTFSRHIHREDIHFNRVSTDFPKKSYGFVGRPAKVLTIIVLRERPQSWRGRLIITGDRRN